MTLEMIKLMAITHECQADARIDEQGQENIVYGGPSPDEVTLVDFAKKQGVIFYDTQAGFSKAKTA